MHRLIPLAVFIPVCSLASDPFACVAPEFVDAFVDHGPGSTTRSTSIPAGFVWVSLPQDFELIGSSVAGSTMRVAWKTDLHPDEASATGWTGNLVSGAQWVKSAEDDDTLIGTLSVLDAGEETYNVRFCGDVYRLCDRWGRRRVDGDDRVDTGVRWTVTELPRSRPPAPQDLAGPGGI